MLQVSDVVVVRADLAVERLIKYIENIRKKLFSYRVTSSTSLQGFKAHWKALKSASSWGLVIPRAIAEKFQSNLADGSHVISCKLSPVDPGCFYQPGLGSSPVFMHCCLHCPPETQLSEPFWQCPLAWYHFPKTKDLSESYGLLSTRTLHSLSSS